MLLHIINANNPDLFLAALIFNIDKNVKEKISAIFYVYILHYINSWSDMVVRQWQNFSLKLKII